MRFIREMIARKAAGDEENPDAFNLEGFEDGAEAPDTGDALAAGFEDELETPAPVFEEVEDHANADEPATSDEDFDEEAELDALDAAFPDLEPDLDAAFADPMAEMAAAASEPAAAVAETPEPAFEPVKEDPVAENPRPFPQADFGDDTEFEDIPDPDTNEPMPQLTAADIERAMKNRKRIWHDLPGEDDPLAVSEAVSDAVTRPIRRVSRDLDAKPVSVPLELVDPQADGQQAEAPAMEAPAEPTPAPEAPEMTAMMPMDDFNDEEEPVAEAAEFGFAGATEETEETEATEEQEDIAFDAPAEAAFDAPAEAAFDEPAEPEFDEPVAEMHDTPVEEEPAPVEVAETMDPVFEDIEEDDEVLWPRATEPAAQEPQAPAAEEPVEAAQEEEATPTDIQALMARAALEAAKAPVRKLPEAEESFAEEAPRPQRRPGRVKTRLLGFQVDETGDSIFDRASAAKSSAPDMFPVGWIVVTHGPGRGACFSLHNGVSLIGRGEDQAVCLDFGDNSISRDNHASVAFDDETNQFYLGQGGKSNIVRLNNKPVLSTEELADGSTIRLGETTLMFKAFCDADFGWKDTSGDEAGNAATG